MITITKTIGLTDKDKEKLAQALSILEKVMNSKSFQSKILAATFKETNGLTNEQVYQTLVAPYSIAFRKFSSWKWWSRVVAWVTGKNATTIHYAAKFFNVNKPYEVAGTLLHECSHAKGFYHRTKPWRSTVPYMMNEIVESVAKELGLT